MPDWLGQPRLSPDRPVTKRDLEQLRVNRELMRQAGLEGPAIMLPGETNPMIRRFAQETFMNMKMLDPGAFQGKTIDDWERGIKAYIASRRPEFRTKLIGDLKKKYEQGGGSPETPQVIIMGAKEEVKKAAYRQEVVRPSTMQRAIKKIRGRKEKGVVEKERDIPILDVPLSLPPIGKKGIALSILRKAIRRE